ncbi:MAG: hypothetical protein CMB81_02630 [Flammeovirgaceae bacterium]|nr:hypothetical protein [Flammeovirgaceae bacterium]
MGVDMKKIIIITILLIVSNNLISQSPYSNFLSYKKLFNEKKYSELINKKLTIKKSDQFYPYIEFYRSVSLYKINKKKESLDLFKELIKDYSEWTQIEEVLYWAIIIELELNNIDNALEYFSKIKDNIISDNLYKYFDPEINKISSFTTLKNWREKYPRNLVVAKYYGRKLLKEYLDDDALDEIKNLLEIIPKKDLFLSENRKFTVSVLLPFMYSGDNNNFFKNNSFVLDLYSGIKYAYQNLGIESENIIFKSFDTKRDLDVVRQIISSGELDNTDLIIGPLYGKPIEIIKQFCLENKILMINPLSSNSMIIKDNNYSLLFQPSLETIASSAAMYATTNYNSNKNVIIFYENNFQDSLIAYNYQKHIEKDSFKVIYSKSVSLEDSRLILDSLSSTYEEILNDSIYDTLKNISELVIKDGRGIEDLDTTYKYLDKFYIENDSIGHVFVSSKNSLFASNIVSAVDIREDTIPVLGFDQWLDYNVIAVDQFENLKISLVSPSYHYRGSENYINMQNFFINETGRKLTMNFIYGVELMNMIMKINSDYGDFFQFGIRNESLIEGVISNGSYFGQFNDNQIVPIIMIKNSEIKLEN